MNQNEQKELIDSLQFASEFLKITRGVQTETKREDHLPDEIMVHLANQQLNSVISELNLEPETLIWGMLNVIEILIRYAELEPEELVEMIDFFIQHKRGELNGDE